MTTISFLPKVFPLTIRKPHVNKNLQLQKVRSTVPVYRLCKRSSLPDGCGSCGGIVPGTSGHGDPAVFCAALPDADNLPLHVLLAAESADVLGVLRDLHLLNSLTEGGAVPGHIKQTK